MPIQWGKVLLVLQVHGDVWGTLSLAAEHFSRGFPDDVLESTFAGMGECYAHHRQFDGHV